MGSELVDMPQRSMPVDGLPSGSTITFTMGCINRDVQPAALASVLAGWGNRCRGVSEDLRWSRRDGGAALWTKGLRQSPTMG